MADFDFAALMDDSDGSLTESEEPSPAGEAPPAGTPEPRPAPGAAAPALGPRAARAWAPREHHPLRKRRWNSDPGSGSPPGTSARRATHRRRRPPSIHTQDLRAARRERQALLLDDPTPASKLALARSLSDVVLRTKAETVLELFDDARANLADPVQNDGFRAGEASQWRDVLAFGAGPFVPDERRVRWETLVFHGRELHRMFEIRSHAAESARMFRDMALRTESLAEALASADECLVWGKLLALKNLPLRCRDPILATAGTVLQNLRLKLDPFLRCYLRTRAGRTAADLLAFPRLCDARCAVTYTLIMLAKIAGAVESGAENVPDSCLCIDTIPLQEYVPGACLAGVLQTLGDHQRTCGDRACRLVCSYSLIPQYVHGKYFYCNEIF
ncbi:multifunctional expression regulator [Beluga whale alphaherpesvirus 1]|uniref:Multifunctional expression regulator n=1 Tax=Beluga whale alphaherpesvirus 1 TaxID=1434720 RepID=A0A286RUF6_9ALPH|nr:multifunctional expression regulator [Beluga whale alphaherpesvirus 1]ASW27051.1 multifunctional expression regulator [Beluga whale alphaherpesvirus 1]